MMRVRFRRGESKNWFFDRQSVIDRVGEANARILGLAGWRVRRAARKLIKPRRRMSESAYLKTLPPDWAARRKRLKRAGEAVSLPPWQASRPGEAPRSITGLLRENITSAIEPDRDVAVIGPELLSGGANALEALEHGGNTKLTAGKDKGKTIHVAARPFMEPALQREAEGIAELWRDRI